MRAIIAALVAVSMAIFPISMAPAAVPGGGHHGVPGVGHHGPSGAGVHDHDHGRVVASVACDVDGAGVMADRQACHPDAGSDGQSAAFCCGGLACHFFHVSAAPALSAPAAKPLSLAALGEEQVASALSDRLDRPPRSV